MGRAIWLSTLGVELGYGIETTAGKIPDDFMRIEGVKSIPDFNPEPETIDVTPLSATEFREYVDGLQDVGGALAFTTNLTEYLVEVWDDGLIPAYETAKTAGLQVWFEIYIPGMARGFFFRGNPTTLGLPAMGVSEALEIDLYITPTQILGFADRIELKDIPAKP